MSYAEKDVPGVWGCDTPHHCFNFVDKSLFHSVNQCAISLIQLHKLRETGCLQDVLSRISILYLNKGTEKTYSEPSGV